jgi:hypothetical protein
VGFVAEHLGLPVALTSVSLFAGAVAAVALIVRALATKKSLPVFSSVEGSPSTAAFRNLAVTGAVSRLLRGYFADLRLLNQPAA